MGASHRPGFHRRAQPQTPNFARGLLSKAKLSKKKDDHKTMTPKPRKSSEDDDDPTPRPKKLSFF
jgi:hypothetical protein